jgi:hypothetical protein
VETDEWLVRRMKHFHGEREAVKKTYMALAIPRQMSMDGYGDRSSFDVSPARTTHKRRIRRALWGPHEDLIVANTRREFLGLWSIP